MPQSTLAICGIVRNEARYIGEWLEFHRLVGVERFFLYDDESSDATLDVIRRHDRGDVEIIPWGLGRDLYRCPVSCEFSATPQITAYNHCILHYAEQARWCAFIDVDEYLYHAAVDDLRTILPLYEPFDAVFVSWLIFGRNGHKTRPAGLTVENYTRRAPPGEPHPFGKHGKIIGQLEHLKYFGPHGSHNVVGKRGQPVDPNGTPAPNSTRPANVGTLRINHYYNRSEAEAREKAARKDRNAVPGYQPDWRRMNIHDRNDVEDLDILRFLPALKTAMKLAK